MMARGELLKRGTKPRQQRPVVLIVTEGAQTEPNYFKAFRTRHNNIDIHIVGGGSGQGTDYASLVKKAITHMEKNGLSVRTGDSLWVVVDADVNYNNPDPVSFRNRQLMDAKKLAAKHGIRIALSNPCFELWYLLHFRYSSAYIKDYPNVLSQLKNHLPNYEKTVPVNVALWDRLAQAMENAKKLEAYHTANGHRDLCSIEVNPYTNVHELVSLIS